MPRPADLTVAALLAAAAAAAAPALAQPAPPQRVDAAQPFLQPADAGDGPGAAAKDANQYVIVRDSSAAQEKFNLAMKMERLKEWGKSADLYQEVLEKYRDRVIPAAAPAGGAAAANVRYTSVTWGVLERLAHWPREGLDVYRGRNEAKAAEVVASAKGDDLGPLYDAFSRYFVTEAAKRAGLRLIDAALERGEYAAAARIGDQLLDNYPTDDLVAERPGVLFRTALAHTLAGDAASRAKGKERADELAKSFPKEMGVVRGKDAVLADVLRTDLAALAGGAGPATAGAGSVAAGSGDSWPTFGGGPARSLVSTANANPGTRLYSLPLAKPTLGRGSPSGTVQQQQSALEEAGRTGQNTGVMPVADRGELFFQDGARVYAAALESGVPLQGWLQTYPDTSGQFVLREVAGSTRGSQQSVTVTDRHVLAVMGQVDRLGGIQYGQAPQPPGEPRLVCLDRSTGAAAWTVQLSTVAGVPKNEDERAIRGLTMSGAPLVVGDTVLVAGRTPRTAQGEDCYVLSFDLGTGKFRWGCFVASSGVPQNPGYPVQQPANDAVAHLAYADGRVYCVSHLGAVASLDAYAGTIAWLSIYPVDVPPMNGRGMPSSFLPAAGGPRLKPWQHGPPVLADGKLFVLPNEGKNLLVYDAATGREVKRISLDKIARWTGTVALRQVDKPTTLVGVVGDHVVLCGPAGIGVYNWAKFDEETFVDGAENPHAIWYSQSTTALAGRPFLTAGAVYAAYEDRVARIELSTGRRVTGSVYPPGTQQWQEGEGPGNLLVVGDHVVVAGAGSVDVYTELALATARLDREVAAAAADPEPRLRYAEVMFAAGQPDAALARLGEAVARMGGPDKLAVARHRDRLFNDALTFGVRASADGRAAPDGNPAARARAAQYFDLAAAAAGTPQQYVQYRLARAKHADQQLRDPTAAVRLYQEILGRADARVVTLSDNQGSAPALAEEVAEKAITALVRDAGAAVYAPFEQAARTALAAAGGTADPAAKAAALQAVAEAYPNATVAPQAMTAAADAFEAGGMPRQAVRVLRQAWFKFQGTPGRAALLEAIARNYLAVPDRNRADMAGTAAARLAMAAQLPGDPKLTRDLKLPDGTVVAKAGDAVSAALEEVRRISGTEAGRLLPDFKVPPQPKSPPWVESPFLPPPAGGLAPALPDAIRLVPAAREFARPDRVVTWGANGLSVFAAGKGLPTAPLVKNKAFAIGGGLAGRLAELLRPGRDGEVSSAVLPRGVAWAGDAALVWGGSRVVCVDATGATAWELDLPTLGQLEVARGGEAPAAPAVADVPFPNGRFNGPVNFVNPGGVRVVVGRGVVPPQQVAAIAAGGGANPNPAQPAVPAAPGGPAGEQVADVRPVGDRVLVVSNTGRIVSVDLVGGRVNWQNRLAEQTPDQVVATEDFTVVRASDDVSVRLVALDTFSGRVIGAKSYVRQNGSFPVNLALSAEGTLVYTLPDKLCLKDLYKGWDEDERVIQAGPPGVAAPPIYAGATKPGQLVIAEGRILALADSAIGQPGLPPNEKYVRVHSLETGQPLTRRYTADGTRREVDQILTSGSKDWGAVIRTVGAKVYVIGSKTVYGYNLDRPAEAWKGTLNLFDADFVDDGNFRDAFVGTTHLVMLDQPTAPANPAAAAAANALNNGGAANNAAAAANAGVANPAAGAGNPAAANQDAPAPAAYRLYMLRRSPAPSAPNKGESGVLDHIVSVTDPAGVAPQWQACDGGFYYATNDGKVRVLLGAEQGK
jgi:outer membrane protein assembly factor BamB